MVQLFVMSKSKKNKEGIIYSTNPDFFTDNNDDDSKGLVPPEKQKLRIYLDKSNRKGKTVTLIIGFSGNEEQLKSIEKELKTKCAAGGSSKNNEIILQGDFRTKAEAFLKSKGFKII